MPVVGQQAIPQDPDRAASRRAGIDQDALAGSNIAILSEPRQAGQRALGK